MYKTTRDKFLERVEKTAGCWNWLGTVDREGYGRFGARYAHRFSYELANEKAAGDFQIDHMCHNRACVNPDHLRRVTNKQNQENRRGPNSNSKSGVRGVYWNKRLSKWTGELKHNGKSIHVGTFATVEEAGAAVDAKRGELFTCNTLEKKAA